MDEELEEEVECEEEREEENYKERKEIKSVVRATALKNGDLDKNNFSAGSLALFEKFLHLLQIHVSNSDSRSTYVNVSLLTRNIMSHVPKCRL